MEKDQGKLIALVSLLIADAGLQGASLDEMLEAIDKFATSPMAIREAAIAYEPSYFAKLNFPLSYFFFKKARIKLDFAQLTLAEERYWTSILMRSASRLEFGVPVNVKWYGALITLTKRKGVPLKTVKRFLGASTVYWTKDGDLLIKQHHWITKALIAIGSLVILLVGLAIPLCLLCSSTLPPWKSIPYALGFFSCTCLPLLYVNWQIGPRSWKAARELSAFRDLQNS